MLPWMRAHPLVGELEGPALGQAVVPAAVAAAVAAAAEATNPEQAVPAVVQSRLVHEAVSMKVHAVGEPCRLWHACSRVGLALCWWRAVFGDMNLMAVMAVLFLLVAIKQAMRSRCEC